MAQLKENIREDHMMLSMMDLPFFRRIYMWDRISVFHLLGNLAIKTARHLLGLL